MEFGKKIPEKTGKKSKCKGLVWKCYVNSYMDYSSGRITSKTELRLLKKKSCSGCDDCEYLRSVIEEELCNDSKNNELFKELEHGKLYYCEILVSQGYYDVYPEIDGIEFYEYKEERNGK